MSGLPTGSTVLDLLEPGWRRHLASGEPAGALDVRPDMLDAVARALGERSRSERPAVLARRWPACVVVALAQVTACHDRSGNVWPAWHRAARSRMTRRSSADWGEAFLGSLAVLGIQYPAGEPRHPRQAVLAHAAVTAPCLPEFLRLAGIGAPERDLARLHPAVAALLRLPAGPGFVERCHALMALLVSGGEPAAADLAGLSLPGRVVDAARQVAADNPGLGKRRTARLVPFGEGVLARDLAPGTGCGSSDADQGIGGDFAAAGSWTAASPDEVTDPADPLLAFGPDGEAVGAVLPPEAVWLVHPANRTLRADAAPRVLVTSRLPLTWNGWRLVQVDLSGVTWLELEPAGEQAPRRHPVRGRPNARLVAGAPVPGIHTLDGLAVFSTLPTVRLPAGAARWRVEVRRRGSRGILAASEASGDRWDPDALWHEMPRPVLGDMVVTATALDAARGTGLRRAVALAEGLAVSYAPALRLTGEQGLEPAEAVLSPAPGMTASPCAAVIPAHVTGVEVACVAGPVVLPLRVTPPHCRIRIEAEPGGGGISTAWHTLGPLPLDLADLARGGALRLDLPGAAGDPPVEVIAARGVVQVLEPTKEGRYPLRRMLDTVSAHGGAALRITVGARTAVIARIAGPAPATDPWVPG